MVGGRTRLNLACSNLPAAQDPRFVLRLSCEELRPPAGENSGEQLDVLLVVRMGMEEVMSRSGASTDELGRTESVRRRRHCKFEAAVTFDWRSQGQQLHVDAYYTNTAAAAARVGPLDLILDCELIGRATTAVEGLDRALQSGPADMALELTSMDSKDAALGTVTLHATAVPLVHGAPVVVVHSMEPESDLVEVGRTEVMGASSNPKFDRSVTVGAKSAAADTQLRVDVYQAPPTAAGRPGGEVDVGRGCAYIGSARCTLADALSLTGVRLKLRDLRKRENIVAFNPKRLRSASTEGSSIAIRGTAVPTGLGAPIVVAHTLVTEEGRDGSPTREIETVSGRTEVVSPTVDPKFEAITTVTAVFRKPQKLRFDIYYASGAAAGGEKSEAELARELSDAVNSRDMPAGSTWEDVVYFDKNIKVSERFQIPLPVRKMHGVSYREGRLATLTVGAGDEG